MHLETDLSEIASDFWACLVLTENNWPPFCICLSTVESKMS